MQTVRTTRYLFLLVACNVVSGSMALQKGNWNPFPGVVVLAKKSDSFVWRYAQKSNDAVVAGSLFNHKKGEHVLFFHGSDVLEGVVEEDSGDVLNINTQIARVIKAKSGSLGS